MWWKAIPLIQINNEDQLPGKEIQRWTNMLDICWEKVPLNEQVWCMVQVFSWRRGRLNGSSIILKINQGFDLIYQIEKSLLIYYLLDFIMNIFF